MGLSTALMWMAFFVGLLKAFGSYVQESTGTSRFADSPSSMKDKDTDACTLLNQGKSAANGI